MKKAKILQDESVGDDLSAKEAFVAPQGWLEKFIKRNYLSLHRQTTTAQKDPSHVINKTVAYLLQAHRLSDKFKYNPASIIAMDETAVWADTTTSTTVETTGNNRALRQLVKSRNLRIHNFQEFESSTKKVNGRMGT